MGYRYSQLDKFFIRLYRIFVPTVDSPYTLGPIDDICAVFLVDPEKMRAYFAGNIELLRKVRGENIGDYFEFGVFNGTSLSNMHFAARKARAKIKFFGFDAFEGLPAESEQADAGVFKKGFYTCSLPQLEKCLERKQVDKRDVTLIQGWYKDTLNSETARRYGLTNPGIVFIDCDTYGSSKTVLEFLTPLITQPTIIHLDDWRLYGLDLKGEGEYLSFNEFLEENPRLTAREIPSYKRNARSFVVQPR